MKKIILCFLLLYSLYPVSWNVNADEAIEPEIISESAILVDSRSGAILFEKNAENKMFPASLTKIATAIYAIESGNLDDIVTVSKEATETEGTSVFLEEGEEVKLKKLLQGMLINSGNDAAFAIAQHLDGDMNQFADHLNRYLSDRVKLKNTHFTNPHGLHNPDHYTTAEDLAILVNFALQNETLKKIYGTKELKWSGKSWDTTIVTHHRMLKGEVPFKGMIGGKTGFVDEAKQTLATTAKRDTLELTAIVLKADYKRDIYKDTKSLLNYGFEHYKSSKLHNTEVYKADGKTFTTGGEDVFITVPAAHYEEEVSEKGKLSIKNNNGKIIQTVKLQEEKTDEVISHHLTAEVEASNKNITGYYTMITILLILFIGIVFRSRRIRKR